jgi:hypothetical protein
MTVKHLSTVDCGERGEGAVVSVKESESDKNVVLMLIGSRQVVQAMSCLDKYKQL